MHSGVSKLMSALSADGIFGEECEENTSRPDDMSIRQSFNIGKAETEDPSQHLA